MQAGRSEGIETDRSIAGLLRRSRRLAAAFASLVVLDARRTFDELVWIACVAIAGTVLLVTAWLAFVVAIAGWIIGNGVGWPGVLAIAALVNVLAAAGAGWWLWKRVHEMPFAATLRQLRGDAPPPEQERERVGGTVGGTAARRTGE